MLPRADADNHRSCHPAFFDKMKQVMTLATLGPYLAASVSLAATFLAFAYFRKSTRTTTARIEESEKTKLEFLATVSHELKTPLTAIKEGLLFLRDNRGDVNRVHLDRTLDICLNSTKKLELMIQNLLNHAKMEAGMYEFDDKPKDFVAVVNNAIHGLRPIADRRGQAIEVYTHSHRCWGVFSAEGISHAVENMLMNAIKYADPAHPIAISIRRIEEGQTPQLEFKVTNHGKEILATEIDQLFKRFFRASNSGGQQGVGLGLNLVKRIIEAHQGSISVESEDGITIFTFRIPQVNEPVEISA